MNKSTTIRIETDRLILDKGTIEDFVKVYEYNFQYLRDVDNIEFIKLDPKTIEEWFEDDINKYYEDKDIKRNFDWIIYLKETHTPIGNITADRGKDKTVELMSSSDIELAFNLHPNYWKQGYMREATTAVLDYLFSIGYDNVISGYADFNKASARVSEALEFEPFNENNEFYKYLNKDVKIINTIMNKEKWLNKKEVKLIK